MDKVNNKKLKQYKKKLTTKGRVDMSKGGRVKKAVGGTQELKNITNYTPMPKKKPVQVGEPVRDKAIQEVGGPARPNRNLGNLRRGAAPTPPEGKLKQVSMVEGNPLPELSQAEKDRRQKLAQARIDANKKLMEQNPLKPVIQNLDNQRIDSPKPIQLIPKDRVPPKQPPMSVG